MTLQEARPPRTELFRVARGNPFVWPDWDFIGGNRFDDPENRYRVLYLAEERSTCFLETLAHFRPRTSYLAQLRSMPAGDNKVDDPEAGIVPGGWCQARRIGSMRLLLGQKWLDFRAPETWEHLRKEMAVELAVQGFEYLDAGDALSRTYTLTRLVSRWAYQQGYQGIAYSSRYDTRRTCWAVFDGAGIAPVSSDPISSTDIDLLIAIGTFSLRLQV